MEIKQRKQKILILFLYLVFWALWFFIGISSYFAPPEEPDRSKLVFMGFFMSVAIPIIAMLWFFFGSIDWSTWDEIKRMQGNKEGTTDAKPQKDADQ